MPEYDEDRAMLFPELREYPGWRKRLREVSRALATAPALLALSLLVFASLALGAGIAYAWLLAPLRLHWALIAVLITTFLVTSTVSGVIVLLEDHIRWELRRSLRKEGSEFCYNCGYHLRGRRGTICTECGQDVDDERPRLPSAARFLYWVGLTWSVLVVCSLAPLSFYRDGFETRSLLRLGFWVIVGASCFSRLFVIRCLGIRH